MVSGVAHAPFGAGQRGSESGHAKHDRHAVGSHCGECADRLGDTWSRCFLVNARGGIRFHAKPCDVCVRWYDCDSCDGPRQVQSAQAFASLLSWDNNLPPTPPTSFLKSENFICLRILKWPCAGVTLSWSARSKKRDLPTCADGDRIQVQC